jgi:hypothetical protein
MERGASKSSLLYVADLSAAAVDVFSYPSGTLVGTLTGFDAPAGLCADQKGDVYVTDVIASDIVEYGHAGTAPIRTLRDRTTAHPNSCAVDPTTGNLAVANLGTGDGTGRGDIATYIRAHGRPRHHRAMYHPYNCGYDNAGNLFVDGENNGFRQFEFGTIPAAGTQFERINLHQSFQLAGGVIWDGVDVAVGDVFRAAIYRFRISGRSAIEVGTTRLDGAGESWAFTLDRRKAIVPNVGQSGASSVNVYDYPAGGTPVQTIGSGILDSPVGVALSHAR